MFTYHPNQCDLSYTFGGNIPAAQINPGNVILVTTEDCFNGYVKTIHDLPSHVCDTQRLNPVSGPFHVVGAEPGDTLALHLVSIRPRRHWAISSIFPYFGALTSTVYTATLQPPLQEKVWPYAIDTAACTVRYQALESDHSVDLPMEPMIGTVGLAPSGGEVRSTLIADRHGGNLDTPEIRSGVTVYLGVNVEGAYFALGDGHLRQGHGEACGVGVESAMEVALVIDLIKNVHTPWPRLESDTTIMSIGCARPLEDAYRISQHDLVHWVSQLTGLELLDTYQLVSQAGTSSVGNVCDPHYTMVAKIEKKYLPGFGVAYENTHHRSRDFAECIRTRIAQASDINNA